MSSFWRENVSKSHGKHNIPVPAWEKICKIQNSPIQLIKDFLIGGRHKPNTILPQGSIGYLIDFPEAFSFSEEERQQIATSEDSIPAVIRGYPEIVFLKDDDYEIIEPFFNMALADLAAEAAKSCE